MKTTGQLIGPVLAVAFLLIADRARADYMQIAIGTHDYCSNATGVALVSTNAPAPLTILWNNGATTETITGLSAGTIWVDVIDGNGVVYTDTAEVIGYSELPFSTGASVHLASPVVGHFGLPCEGQCNGAYGFPGPPTTGLSGPFTYTFDPWITFEGFEPFYGYPVYSGFCEGVTTNYTYTDINGCSGNGMLVPGAPFTIPLDVIAVLTTDFCQNGTAGTAQLVLETSSVSAITVELYRDGSYYGTDVGTLIDSLPPGYYDGTLYAFEPDIGGTIWPHQCGGSSFSFTINDLGAGCGRLEGEVWYDQDADCVFDGNEVGMSGNILAVEPGGYNAYVGSNGLFSIQLPAGNYSLEQLDPFVDPICPVVQPIPFTVAGNTTSIDLANGSTEPMDIQLSFALSAARPGFNHSLHGNVGNPTPQATGPVTVVCEADADLQVLSATSGGTVAGNTITWDLSDLSYFGSEGFGVTLFVPASLSLGTEITHTCTATNPLPEVTLANNTYSNSTIVTGSYDPNNKLAQTSSRSSDDLYFIDDDEWIDYTIRFQNTGTDTAFTVVITDTIDAALDMSSFEMGAASHPVEVAFRVGRVIAWTFTNILLPDSNVNESASHGLVSFRIRPHLPILPGTAISNIANIYFDYNEPVITEPSALVAEFSTAMTEVQDPTLLLAPIPMQHMVSVTAPAVMRTLNVIALDGRVVLRSTPGTQTYDLNVAQLDAGPYVIIADLENGDQLRQRVIKH